MSTNYNRLMNNLEELKLISIRDSLPRYMDMMADGSKTPVDAMPLS